MGKSVDAEISDTYNQILTFSTNEWLSNAVSQRLQTKGVNGGESSGQTVL